MSLNPLAKLMAIMQEIDRKLEDVPKRVIDAIEAHEEQKDLDDLSKWEDGRKT